MAELLLQCYNSKSREIIHNGFDALDALKTAMEVSNAVHCNYNKKAREDAIDLAHLYPALPLLIEAIRASCELPSPHVSGEEERRSFAEYRELAREQLAKCLAAMMV